MTRIDKAKEHKQPAGQDSQELAGLIAAIEAEFDSHIAQISEPSKFSQIRDSRALAIVKTQLRQPESPEAALAEAMELRIFQLWPGLFGRAIFVQISSRFCQTGFFAMCAQNWKSPILVFNLL